MIVFNGKEFALEKERALQSRLEGFPSDSRPAIGCIVFFEDQGGIVYSQEKKLVAERLGIEYSIVQTSMSEPLEQLQKLVLSFAKDPQITGIIIQKPWRKTWEAFHMEETHDFESFQVWWHALTSLIPLSKDIDGLHPDTLQRIKEGTLVKESGVLPATCRAVLSILDNVHTQTSMDLTQEPVLIIGRSELLGLPLYFELKNRGWHHLELVGQLELRQLISQPEKLTRFKTIITSTGVQNLVNSAMIAEGCILIDAGFPQGDIDFDSVLPKSAFITPVPNGVGPVTVISLLENAVELWYNSRTSDTTHLY
jgi:methylenetetrahydrofolate dehydrogenase (NADP+)/methenyltetrahydrofolate cyclohydrolase